MKPDRLQLRQLCALIGIALIASLLTVTAVAGALPAVNTGPNPVGPATVDCVARSDWTPHTVVERNSGRFTDNEVVGGNYFDATDVVFDGLHSDNRTLQRWPVTLRPGAEASHDATPEQAAGQDAIPSDAVTQTEQEVAFVESTLVARPGRGTRQIHEVVVPSGLDAVSFQLDFDIADPGRRLYMRLTDPDGVSTLFNHPTNAFESASMASPKPGTWTVYLAKKAPVQTDVDYTLRVTGTAPGVAGPIVFGGFVGLLTPDDKRHTETVTVAESGLDVRFFAQFDQADPGERFYIKVTDPAGGHTFFNEATADFELAEYPNAMAGDWTIRVATKSGTDLDVAFELVASHADPEPPGPNEPGELDGCWIGGSINGAWDENGTGVHRIDDGLPVEWEWPFHHAGGMTIELDNFLIENVSVVGQGDGIRSYGDNNVIDGAYTSDIHDDCVENDDLKNLLVTDSFFDGCYVAFSARVHSNESHDGSDNLFEIRDSLVRMEAQPTVYKPERYGPGPGHGQVFKWTDNAATAIQLSVHNTIFLIEGPNRHQSDGSGLGVEEIVKHRPLESCSNNLIVWTGDGEFPNRDALPDCFEITTDFSKWIAAEDAWRARHPGRP